MEGLHWFSIPTVFNETNHLMSRGLHFHVITQRLPGALRYPPDPFQ